MEPDHETTRGKTKVQIVYQVPKPIKTVMRRKQSIPPPKTIIPTAQPSVEEGFSRRTSLSRAAARKADAMIQATFDSDKRKTEEVMSSTSEASPRARRLGGRRTAYSYTSTSSSSSGSGTEFSDASQRSVGIKRKRGRIARLPAPIADSNVFKKARGRSAVVDPALLE